MRVVSPNVFLKIISLVVFTGLAADCCGQGTVTFGSDKNNKGVTDSLTHAVSKKFTLPQTPKALSAGERPMAPKSLQKYLTFYKSAEDIRQLAMNRTLPRNISSADPNTILNSKYLRKYSDSIKRMMPKMPPNNFKEIPQSQMVSEVNKQFQEEASSVKDSIKGETSGAVSKVDLARTKIDQANLQNLKPLSGRVTNSKYLTKLESIRKLDLREKKINLSEQQLSEKAKAVVIKRKESLWSKSYLEGIITMGQSSSTILKVSPAYGYHLTPRFSVGAGPSITIKKDVRKLTTTAGLRVFTKAEFYKRMFYLQVEDQINPHTVNTESRFFTQHNLYGGGGVVLTFLQPLSVNASVLYKGYSNGSLPQEGSPWIFRLGISTIKKEKK